MFKLNQIQSPPLNYRRFLPRWFVHTALMSPFDTIPLLEIFLGILGFGLSIMFCTTFCRACSRLRQEEIEREVWRRSEQDGRPPPIYFIPIPGSMSQADVEDARVPRFSQELHTPPQYSTAYCGAPPSYNELELKPDDLPPAYTEHNFPGHPNPTQSQTDMEHDGVTHSHDHGRAES